MFDIGDVSRDEWQASSRRHATMSLLREARRMIEGGYRKLLRHRHRRG
ncbi:DNA -binding domain-containing protein [Klebsiella pneumoniae]